MYADGTVAHAMSRHAIRESIYTGRVTANAKVRHDGQGWDMIGGYPEFAVVFRLLGDDLAPIAGTRKLAGWKSSAEFSLPPPPSPPTPPPNDLPMLRAHLSPSLLASDPPAPPPFVPKPPTPALPPRPPRVAAPVPPPASGGGVPLWVVGAAVIVLGAVAWLIGAGR
jgi:hypothetical protein